MDIRVLERPLKSEGRAARRCRLCGAGLEHTFVDLGVSPLCESFLAAGQLDQMEPHFPLHVLSAAAAFWFSWANT